MSPGIPFVSTAIGASLVVSFVMTLLELNFGPGLAKHTFRRWGKFLLLLGILGIVIQFLTLLQG